MIANIPQNNMEVRKKNMSTLFNSIVENSPVSKRGLQALTGLSWGVVSTVSSQLLDMGYIITVGKQDADVGRKPDMMDINPCDHYIIGLDLNLSGLCGVVTDMKGRVVRKWRRIFLYNSKECVLKTTFSLLEEMISTYSDKQIEGIGFAVQGVVDTDNGISVRLPQVPDWKDVELKSMVEERFGYPVLVMHDPVCIMIAEQAFGDSVLKTAQNAVILRIDSGFGMATLINRQPYFGSNGRAGEIGHISVCEDGPICSCGKRGCLEEYVSGQGILRRFAEKVNQGAVTSVKISAGDVLDINVLATAAREGDELCLKLFEQMGSYLGWALGMIFNIFNPDIVVLYGYMMEHRDLFHKYLKEELDLKVYDGIPTRLLYSSQGEDAAACGASRAMSSYLINNLMVLAE